MNDTMKAFVRINSETQEVEMQEVPLPTITSEEVLIEVKAFGVGIHDRYFIPSDARFPYVIGSEGAGLIKDKGAEVTNFEIGDSVIYTTSLQPEGGTWAEYAVANQKVLIKKPKDLSYKKAAAIPIAGKTALECMRELHLSSGDTLFIAGASGAIGTMVIQLAETKGIRISASASQKNHSYMTSLGAEHTVDYHDPDWIRKVKEWSNGGVSSALAIQPGTGADSIQVVKDNGILITVSGDGSSVSSQRGIKVHQMGHELGRDDLAKLVQAIAKDDLKVIIEQEFAFSESLDALRKTETRHARGKLVVHL